MYMAEFCHRSLYSAAIVGYFVKVVYPKLRSQKLPPNLVRNATENDLAIALKRSKSTNDPKSADASAASAASKNPTVNREFVARLRKLLKIMIPGIWTVEAGILSLHTLSLVIRTFLSIYVAKLEGKTK